MMKYLFVLWVLFSFSISSALAIDFVPVTHYAADYVDCAGGRKGPVCPKGRELVDTDGYSKTLLDFDSASGTNWPEWTYSSDINGYGAAGYAITGTDPNVGASTSTGRFTATWSFDQNGSYGGGTTLSFDTTDYAPSKTMGASARFLSNTTDNQVSWWVWTDSWELSKRGITDVDTDRMSFYVKIEGMADNFSSSGGSNYGFHVGTYVCDDITNGVGGSGSGSGCPYEGPGNNHYYHYLGLNSGAWIHVELDEQPQHLRTSGRPPLNPPVALYGFDGYYANMHQYYMEIRNSQASQTTMWLDEIAYYSTSDSPEPNQNQQSISSVWVGYWVGADEWQISWSDTYQAKADNSFSTFEVRYSTSPITNTNWDSATPITPKYFTGPLYESNPSNYAIRKVATDAEGVWTSFDLPDNIEASGATIYFAIKDITIAGGNAGSQWPYTKPDGIAPPTSNIRTIDYVLP